MKGGIGDDLIVAGKADDSYLVKRLLGEGDEDRMPLKKPALPDEEIELIKRWIDQGAVLPAEPPPVRARARRAQAPDHRPVPQHPRDLFGPAVALPTQLEPDTLVAGSATVGAARIGLSEYGVERFTRAAFELSAAALRRSGVRRALRALRARGRPSRLRRGLRPRASSERFGRRAWRRPLPADETERYVSLARGSAERGPRPAGWPARR